MREVRTPDRDMMPMLGPTNDHTAIREWAAMNKAVPVTLKTRVFDGEPSKVGFVFRGARSEAPEFKPISWENFFAVFDLLKLSFVCDEDRPETYELLQEKQDVSAGFTIGLS